MTYGRISIESDYNPNPHKKRTFTVTCHHDRILTTVTATPSVVRDWLYNIRRIHSRSHTLVVGLGVQWRPGPLNNQHAATLQLCVGHHCLVFLLLHATYVPFILRRFLSDPHTTFVGVWNRRDGPLLRRSKHDLSVSALVDIRDVAAERRGYSKRISMKRLAGLILGIDGVKKLKWVGMNNWEAYWLSEEQVQYTCLDAFLSFSMGKALKVWNWP